MPTFKAPADRGDRIDYDGKGIRLVNGARLLQRSPMLYDHFTYGAGALNSHVPQNWVTTETGAATAYAPSTTIAGGALVGVCGATTNNAEEVAGKNVGWAPATMATNNNLVMEVRAKFVGTTTATDGDFYIGFANAVTFTNGLPYVVGASSLLTTSAPVEFAGFGYSSIPSSGVLFNSGASGATGNFVGIVTEISSVAPVLKSTAIAKDSSFHVYRIEMDALANAAFYIDDAFVGYTAVATTAATALTPYITTIAKNSHAQTATIDYWFVGGDVV